MLNNKPPQFEAIIQYHNNRYYRLTNWTFNSKREAKIYIKNNVDDRLKCRCRVEKII